MQIGKCKLCGKYETRQKEVSTETILDEIEISLFRMWKWCKLHNNWCRNIAGNCGEVIGKAEKKLEGETNEII